MARKVLLADDSVTAQNMGRRILHDAGYEVITVNNGSAAMKRIAESKPDLIVLDVYMPGYGGLEVCQRIRESEETARIPVLLTVGKLEPFKPDEVRRVRADAYIVKPFEASELLAALTKLEDKIVPAKQPDKPRRFPKPMAAVDDSAAVDKEFGDLETGWKNRLKIPAPHQKAHEEFEEEPGADQIQRFARSQDWEESLPAQPESKPSPLPADITADEIAAITAAAATFSAKGEGSADKPEPVSEAAKEPVAARAAEAPAADEEIPTQPVVSSHVGDGPATFASVPEMEVKPEEPAFDDAESTALETAEAGHGKLAQEVAAALENLAPQHGNGSGSHETELNGAEIGTATAAAVSDSGASGPRWIAELIAPTAEESALNLEDEMQKAQALAVAEAAPMTTAAPAMEVRAAESEGPPPTMEFVPPVMEPVPSPEVATPEIASAASVSPAMIEESLADAVADQAETVEEKTSEETKGEAFAASAAAGAGSSDPAAVVEAVSSSAAPAAPPEAGEPEPEHRESELAAAWASWKQIRESVASPQFTSQVAEAATAGFKDIRPAEPKAAQEPKPEAAEAGPEDSGAIASIVDSVLAELKPKLMQEIAKKIGKEKKH